MLKTLVKIAEVVALAAGLAFAVLLFVNPDDAGEVQAAPAAAFPEEAAAAVEANEKARVTGEEGEGEGDGDEGTTTTAESTTTAPPEEGVDGAAVFGDNCASCHGDDGGGGVGPPLQDIDDAGLVVDTVTDGRGSMPSFEGRLEPEEIEAVADYVANEL